MNAGQDDYPSAADLARIKSWPWADAAGCLDEVKRLWSAYGSAGDETTLSAHEQYVAGFRLGDRFLRLATGGWSGNEDLIHALMVNDLVWSQTWCLSARGGLFIFRYPEVTP